jgi:hypothetical protein
MNFFYEVHAMKHLIPLFTVFALVALLTGGTYAQVPANDECSGATVIGSLPFSTAQNTRLATPNPTDPPLPCAEGGGGKSVWFRFTPSTTGLVDFTTEGSTPSTYDIAMGIFTGSCGSLVLDSCNDDIVAGTIRASRIQMVVQSGVMYTILIAEWNGGGDTGHVPTGGDLLFRVCSDSCPPIQYPLVSGPKSGSVPSGVVVNTSSFPEEAIAAISGREMKEAAENEQPPIYPAPADVMPPKGPQGSNYIEERASAAGGMGSSQPVILRNFIGIPDPGQGFPPDPITAVGPNHIMSLVNSTFRIFDKNGQVLKTISVSQWFSTALPGAGPFDPQVIYDHFANRWVMVWDNISSTAAAQLMISVSDDDNPLGTWYNWSIPANNLGDSATSKFSDYPGLGYDNQALYIASNEFPLVGGGATYTKVRIIGKAQLYANTAGPLAWTDFWDFREPDHRSYGVWGIRPALTYGTPGTAFFLTASPYSPGTFFTLWKLTNPLTSPSFTAVNIPVVQYLGASAADQLGGSSGYLIETGGSGLHFPVVYRDSSIWIAHSVASGTGNAYSAVHYIRFNPFTNTNMEDVAMGLDGYWHYYTSLMVNQDRDVIITYTRSSLTEYAGAFLTGRRETDPPGLAPSVLLKRGEGNYVLVGGGRNRWGDYNGIALDPSDGKIVWAFGEYSKAPANDFSTWVGEVKMAPVPGRYAYAQPLALNFGVKEKGTIGDTLSATIINYGLDSLTISAIAVADSNFALVNLPALPARLATFDTVFIHTVFTPKAVGLLAATLLVTSDDAPHSPIGISLQGQGFVVTVAQTGTLYAAAGDLDSGKVLTMSPLTGKGTAIGKSGFSKVLSTRVHPHTHELMGLVGSGVNTVLARINSAAGDAHAVSTIPMQLLKGMAFRGDTLYIGRLNGVLYTVNIQTGALTQIANTGLSISGLDFNPSSGQLWASGRLLSGGSLDRIYKISLPSGTPTVVGSTGLGTQVTDIVFDGNGTLFGVIGSTSPSNLVVIDTVTGAGTIVGPVGFTGVQALAMDPATTFPTYTYRLAAQWNIVSLPVVSPARSKSIVFPTAASSAFTYTGGYSTSDTLVRKLGYWLKFNAPAVSTVSGAQSTRDTINVMKRWNMIGSISFPVPVASVQADPPGIVTSNYLAYQSGGYVIADSIHPGNGYWVRVSSDGTLILASSPSLAVGSNAPAGDGEFLEGMNTLTFRDALGNAQTLFFGRDPGQSFNADRFELPPAPPEGALDARFSSNRMLAVHPDKLTQAVEFPMAIQAPAAPVRLVWHVDNAPGVRYSVVSVKKNSKVSAQVLKGDGSTSLSGSELTDLRLRAEQNLVPAEFALRQNYPNPFNPTTTIRYELPSDEMVTLAVYDILGREVVTLVNDRQTAGYYEIPFRADNVASGIYFYRLTAGKFTDVQKMIVLR